MGTCRLCRTSGRTVPFKDVGCGIVYLPLIYPDGDAVAVFLSFSIGFDRKSTAVTTRYHSPAR